MDSTSIYLYHSLKYVINREKAIEDDPSAKSLESLMELSNQVHGDAIANFLLVEGILRAKGWSVQEWNAIYKVKEDSLNRALMESDLSVSGPSNP